MKKIILAGIVLLMAGCNRKQNREQMGTPDDYTVSGTVADAQQWIGIRVENSELIVNVKRVGEDWQTLNKYEYKKDSDGKIMFRNRVEILPNGNLSFSTPRIAVAPVGTKYEIRSILLSVQRF